MDSPEARLSSSKKKYCLDQNVPLSLMNKKCPNAFYLHPKMKLVIIWSPLCHSKNNFCRTQKKMSDILAIFCPYYESVQSMATQTLNIITYGHMACKNQWDLMLLTPLTFISVIFGVPQKKASNFFCCFEWTILLILNTMCSMLVLY